VPFLRRIFRSPRQVFSLPLEDTPVPSLPRRYASPVSSVFFHFVVPPLSVECLSTSPRSLFDPLFQSPDEVFALVFFSFFSDPPIRSMLALCLFRLSWSASPLSSISALFLFRSFQIPVALPSRLSRKLRPFSTRGGPGVSDPGAMSRTSAA